MGLADALIKMQITYGSKAALTISDETGTLLARTAIATSSRLAAEHGTPYPKYIPEVINSCFIQRHYNPNGLSNVIAGCSSLTTLTLRISVAF